MPQTAGLPGRKMPAFSRAMDSTSGPSQSVWSSPTETTTATSASTTLTASSRPPRPTSSTIASGAAVSKTSRAASVLYSKNVSESPPRASAMRSNAVTRDASDAHCPSIRMRSR